MLGLRDDVCGVEVVKRWGRGKLPGGWLGGCRLQDNLLVAAFVSENVMGVILLDGSHFVLWGIQSSNNGHVWGNFDDPC